VVWNIYYIILIQLNIMYTKKKGKVEKEKERKKRGLEKKKKRKEGRRDPWLKGPSRQGGHLKNTRHEPEWNEKAGLRQKPGTPRSAGKNGK
jgi:hypothetical protein